MGEAKRRKKLDPNYGKIRNRKLYGSTHEQQNKVMELLSRGKHQELAEYIVNSDVYVPVMDRKDVDWNSVEEVKAWSEKAYEHIKKAAALAGAELGM